MNQNAVLAYIREVRRDICNILFHFTRSGTGFFDPATEKIVTVSREDEDQGGPRHSNLIPIALHPYDILRRIIEEGAVFGSSRWIKGGYHCICFTEAPISELPAFFSLIRKFSETHRPRYTPYGIAMTKETLFSKGGRPVIYQPDAEYDDLPESLRWRHVRYEPPDIDFTWEREWRIRTDKLVITPEDALVIVPTAKEAFELTYTFSHAESSPGRNPKRMPRWIAVSLDLLGGNG